MDYSKVFTMDALFISAYDQKFLKKFMAYMKYEVNPHYINKQEKEKSRILRIYFYMIRLA
jgi:hypothetical protein